jgi:enediyne biosynthesis protein E7
MNENQCPFKNLLEPKGPKGFPFIHSMPFIAWDQLKFFTDIREKYGNIAKYKMFGFTCYLVSHPDDLAEVYKKEKQQTTIQKEFFHKAIYEYFGDGLLNSYGKTWETQRKLLKPYFQKSESPKWFPIITEETVNHLQNTAQFDKINGKDIIVPMIQSIMCRILFGVKPENESSKELIKAIELVSDKLLDRSFKSCFFNGVLNRLPTPGNLHYKKALKTIDDSILTMSRADNENKKSSGLLALLSNKMSLKQLRDELFTLFYAGQDTTANAVLWTLYYLAKYPDVQDQVRTEVKGLWPDLDSVTMDETEQMEYLTAVINESLRLSPPAYATFRDVKEDIQIGKYKLKTNALLILSPYVTHRHPELWDKPNEFRPERFINTKNKGLSFYPFGGGMRVCLGMYLARLEITTIVALFVASFQFTLDPEAKKIEKEVLAVLKPKNGVPLRLNHTGFLGDDA